MTKKEIKASVSQKINKPFLIRRSKFNVNRDLSSRTYKDIIYDSAMEMQYFIDVIEPLCDMGLINKYERQKKYMLQEPFRRNGVYIKSIEYVADFYIEYANGLTEVIDIKGDPDNVAKIKRKLFWKRYPEIDYKWITFCKKHGGWLDYDELNKLRLAEKKEKKKSIKEEKDNE